MSRRCTSGGDDHEAKFLRSSFGIFKEFVFKEVFVFLPSFFLFLGRPDLFIPHERFIDMMFQRGIKENNKSVLFRHEREAMESADRWVGDGVNMFLSPQPRSLSVQHSAIGEGACWW